jgi:hypothetical protein
VEAKQLREKVLDMYVTKEASQEEFEETLTQLVAMCLLEFSVSGG